MVKQFYRKFLAVAINLSLLQFSVQSSFAGVTETKGELITDSSGGKSQTIDYKFDGIKNPDMISSITMLGIGTVAARLASDAYKPYTKDVLAAAASGASFIAGEVYSNIAMKKEVEALTLQIQKKTGEKDVENQLERIQELKESYEKVKKTLTTKKSLQMAAAAGFGVAGGIAAYMALQSNSNLMACKSAVSVAAKTFAACSPTTHPESASCISCATTMGVASGEVATYIGSKDAPAPSITIFSKNQAQSKLSMTTLAACSSLPGVAGTTGKGVEKICGAAFNFDKQIQTQSRRVPASSNGASSASIQNDIKIPKIVLFENILNILMPKAHAGWMPLVALTGSALVAYKFITGSIATQIDLFMATPKNRIIVWGSFAALAYTASKSTDKVIKEVDSHIKKLDEIIAELTKLESGIKLGNAGSSMIDTTDLLKGFKTDINNGVTADIGNTCLTGEQSSGACTSLTKQLDSIKNSVELPSSLASLGKDLASLGDSLNGGKISEGTLSSADSIGGKQAAINKALKKQNEVVKKLATKPSVTEKGLLDNLNKQTANNLKRAGTSPGSFLASMGGVPFQAGSSNDLANVDELMKKDELASAKPINGQLVNLAPAKKNNDLDFKLGDDSNFGDSPVNPSLSTISSEDFSQMTGDIANSNGPSLFEIISSRYVKSGYPKLLEVDSEIKDK